MSPPVLEATLVPELTLSDIRNDRSASDNFQVALDSASSQDEPVVIRRELWSYFRVYHSIILVFFATSLIASLQYFTLEITYVSLVLLGIQSTGFRC